MPTGTRKGMKRWKEKQKREREKENGDEEEEPFEESFNVFGRE